MNRRDFLKMIGLGGVALTVPQPLAVIAAKMADLERTPLHVGATEIGPVPGFAMHGVALRVARLTAMRDWMSFAKNWALSMIMRRGSALSRTQFMAAPVDTVLAVPLAFNWFTNLSKGTSSSSPFTEFRVPYVLSEEETVEAWLVPAPLSPEDDTPRPPLRPLPAVMLHLHGILTRDDRFFQVPLWAQFSRVRLERSRAIELGLVGADEPEERWNS